MSVLCMGLCHPRSEVFRILDPGPLRSLGLQVLKKEGPHLNFRDMARNVEYFFHTFIGHLHVSR